MTMMAEDFEFIRSTGRIESRGSYLQRAAAGSLASQRVAGDVRRPRCRRDGDAAIRTTRTSARMNASDTATATILYTADVYVIVGRARRWASAQSTVVAQ